MGEGVMGWSRLISSRVAAVSVKVVYVLSKM